MTSKLCVVVSIVLIAAVMMFAGTAAAAEEILLGDVDSDENVTIMDASFVQRKLTGLRIDGSFSEPAADVDGNGIIEIIDATYIQRYISDIETPYPIAVRPTVPPTEPPTQRPTDSEGWGQDIFRP